jgi:fermentation-respiration switch protein FrsA (DUF1100 family)
MLPKAVLPALLILLVIVALVALLALFQRRLIYLPMTQRVSPVEEVLPDAREVVYRTEDGLDLKAWLVPAYEEPARAVVVVFNGNAGHREFRAPLGRALADQGFTVLLTDYRGCGGNPGKPSEAGLLSDARAAVDFLVDAEGYAADEIAYFGESLGSGVAVALAAERPPLALILRSPFTSLSDVARIHYPFLPVRALLRDRYPSDERIGDIHSPLLVVAGEEDRIVPLRLSRRLYEAAAGRKRLVVIPGADHNDWELLAGSQLITETVSWLRESKRE